MTHEEYAACEICDIVYLNSGSPMLTVAGYAAIEKIDVSWISDGGLEEA